MESESNLVFGGDIFDWKYLPEAANYSKKDGLALGLQFKCKFSWNGLWREKIFLALGTALHREKKLLNALSTWLILRSLHCSWIDTIKFETLITIFESENLQIGILGKIINPSQDAQKTQILPTVDEWEQHHWTTW